MLLYIGVCPRYLVSIGYDLSLLISFKRSWMHLWSYCPMSLPFSDLLLFKGAQRSANSSTSVSASQCFLPLSRFWSLFTWVHKIGRDCQPSRERQFAHSKLCSLELRSGSANAFIQHIGDKRTRWKPRPRGMRVRSNPSENTHSPIWNVKASINTIIQYRWLETAAIIGHKGHQGIWGIFEEYGARGYYR